MALYLIKSTLIAALSYLGYRLAIRGARYHEAHRWVLLLAVVATLCLPLVPLGWGGSGYAATLGVAVAGPEAVAMADGVGRPSLHIGLHNLCLVAYAIGAIVLAIRLLAGLGQLAYLYLTAADKMEKWGFQVVVVDKLRSPSTFFNILFVGPGHLAQLDTGMLLAHEKTHKTQCHAFDNLLLEVLTIVLWFNPFAWLLRRALKLAHEYAADREVLKNGYDLLAYQHMLFRACVGGPANWVNQLSNQSSLEKRFRMMDKLESKSTLRHRLLRVVLALPFVALIVVVGGFGHIGQPDTLPVYKAGAAAMYQTIKQSLRYPASARAENSQGQAYVSFVVSAAGKITDIQAGRRSGHMLEGMVVVGYADHTSAPIGINAALRAETVRVVGALGAFEPATKDGKPVACQLTLPVEFKLR